MKRWLPVVAWSAVILATSNDWFSAAHTGSWLGVSETVNVVLRKLAHVTGYGILGLLALRASRDPSPGPSGHPLPASGERGNSALPFSPSHGEKVAEGRMRGVLFLTYAVVLLVASLDEWNQSFIPSRGGSPWDVLLDVVGATIAIALLRVKEYWSR